MGRLKTAIRLLRHPRKFIAHLMVSDYFKKVLPDRVYLKFLFRDWMDEKLDLKHPVLFNEKIQWLKLYDRNSLYTTLVDKYEVKKYVADRIGSEHIIPTIGVWDSFDAIEFDKLPEQFVLKCTHNSGGIVICKNKSELDMEAARAKIEDCMKENYFWRYREWSYKNVRPRIIAEQYMVDESGTELKDYKFFCFNGEPKIFYLASNRGISTKFDFYDMEFNKLDVQQCYPNSDKYFQKPAGYDKMVDIARRLSEGFIHVRIDLYDINGQVYFGEYTLHHLAGINPITPRSFDVEMGTWLKLPFELEDGMDDR